MQFNKWSHKVPLHSDLYLIAKMLGGGKDKRRKKLLKLK
jgi:hypothetical protein